MVRGALTRVDQRDEVIPVKAACDGRGKAHGCGYERFIAPHTARMRRAGTLVPEVRFV